MVTQLQLICLKIFDFCLELLVDKKIITLKEVWKWGEHPDSRKHLPKFFQYSEAFITHAIANFTVTFIFFSILFWFLFPLIVKLFYPYQDTPEFYCPTCAFFYMLFTIIEVSGDLKNEYSKNGRFWTIGVAWGTAIGVGLALWLFWNIVGASAVMLIFLAINLLIVKHLDRKSMAITLKWEN